jgi:hypothetical protein
MVRNLQKRTKVRSETLVCAEALISLVGRANVVAIAKWVQSHDATFGVEVTAVGMLDLALKTWSRNRSTIRLYFQQHSFKQGEAKVTATVVCTVSLLSEATASSLLKHQVTRHMMESDCLRSIDFLTGFVAASVASIYMTLRVPLLQW